MTKTETERVDTTQLQRGDMVIHYGMEIRLDAPGNTHADDVFAWTGTVTNYEDVIKDGRIPTSFIRDAQYRIQGTQGAYWNRVRPVSQMIYTTETER